MINELKCYWFVYKFFKSVRKTYAWFSVPNPLVGGITPNNMIFVGRSKRLLKIIETQLKENEPQDELENWHWPFLRYNSGGSKEYKCPHGVGHGGIHGCDGCPCDIKTLVRQWRKTTPCEVCGKKPIEYHHPDHPKKPWRRVSSLVNRGSISSVLEEIERCQKLCRSCHMKADKRLEQLHKNKPNQPGSSKPKKSCKSCSKLFKPLRQGLCYRCYENHRIGGRGYKGHQYTDGCCSHKSYRRRTQRENP